MARRLPPMMMDEELEPPVFPPRRVPPGPLPPIEPLPPRRKVTKKKSKAKKKTKK